MEMQFTPTTEAKLSALALQTGRSRDALIRDVVERSLDYEAWFLAKVDRGLAAADRGDVVPHSTIKAEIKAWAEQHNLT